MELIKNQKSFFNKLIIVAFFGMIAVILGAFGSHGLKPRLSTNSYSAYQTGILYHFFHTLSALAVLIISLHFDNKWLRRSFYFFIYGIILFSGSLYLLAIKDLGNLSFLKFAGPITPIGGVLFILAWGMIITAAYSLKRE